MSEPTSASTAVLPLPEELLRAFAAAAAEHPTDLRVLVFQNAATTDGATSIPIKLLPPQFTGSLTIRDSAKLICGPDACFYGIGGAVLKCGTGVLNLGFVLYGRRDDEAADRFRLLGNQAGVAIHAYDLVPGIQHYDAPLVLWMLVVYHTLRGSDWFREMDLSPESPSLTFNPFTASVETLKQLTKRNSSTSTNHLSTRGSRSDSTPRTETDRQNTPRGSTKIQSNTQEPPDFLAPARAWMNRPHLQGGPTKDQYKFLAALVKSGGRKSHADLSTECGFHWEDPRDGARKMVKRIKTRIEIEPWDILPQDRDSDVVIILREPRRGSQSGAVSRRNRRPNRSRRPRR